MRCSPPHVSFRRRRQYRIGVVSAPSFRGVFWRTPHRLAPENGRVRLFVSVERVSEFDAAERAAQAALDAGASYADARVMHRRYESMAARNGDVEDVTQRSDSGVGVRALVGSGWGFF